MVECNIIREEGFIRVKIQVMKVISWVEVFILICQEYSDFIKCFGRGKQGLVRNELNIVLKKFDFLKDFGYRIEQYWMSKI